MRDVEALDRDRHRVAVVGRQAQYFNEIPETRDLRAFLLKAPLERDPRTLHAHLKPAAALLAGFRHDRDAPARHVGEKVGQALRKAGVGFVGFDDDHRRDAHVGVVLRDEGFEDFRFRRHHFVRARVDLGPARAVAQVAPAPHHREVHADDGARGRHREDVRVGVLPGALDRLLAPHGGQRRDAVAPAGGLFKGPGFARGPHALLELFDEVARAAL